MRPSSRPPSRAAFSERNARFFEAEADKFGGWAGDLKLGLEREIKELDCQIKEMRRAATITLTLDDKLAAQKRIKALGRSATRSDTCCSMRRIRWIRSATN